MYDRCAFNNYILYLSKIWKLKVPMLNNVFSWYKVSPKYEK